MARDSRPQLRVVMPEIRNAATALALASVVCSIVWWVLASNTGVSLYLVPGQVLHGLALWQPFTWLLASIQAMPVLFTALILWSIGGSLERRWGKSRFLRFTLGTTFVAGLLTLAISFLVTDLQRLTYMGGSAMSSMVWVAWGLVIWNEQTNLFGFPLSGRTFAMIGVLIPLLNGVFGGLLLMVPEYLAIILAFVIIRGEFSPGDLWVRFQSARLQRDLKKRSSRLSVITGGERNMPKDSDKYLH
jgi:membrane associated rhomboid family serine protease